MEFGRAYLLVVTTALLSSSAGFEVGPCYTQNIVDIDFSYYNSYVTTNVGASLPTVSMDQAPNLSTNDHDFDVCYFGEAGERKYHTVLSSVKGYYYLVESGSSSVFNVNSATITSINDFRLHENDLIVDSSISLYKSPSSARRLYGTAPAAGYGAGDHWWFLLPYSSSTGSSLTAFYTTWGTAGASFFRNQPASLGTLQSQISLSLTDAIKRAVSCRGICGPNKFTPNEGDLTMAFTKTGLVRMKSPKQLGWLEFTAFETILYTIYQSIEGGQLPSPQFNTRNAVVIREKTTGLVLAPITNNRNRLRFVGQWSESEDSQYARVKAQDYNRIYAGFQSLAVNSTGRVLEQDVKDQKYPDARFFYFVQASANEYYLELVSHKGFFLAVLSEGFRKSLVVTRKAAEIPGTITFKFKLTIPAVTNDPLPPNLGNVQRLINNNYNNMELKPSK